MNINNFDELVKVLDYSKVKFSGSNSKVILYNNTLIKIEKLLYEWLSENNFNEFKLFKIISSSLYRDCFKPSEELIEYYNKVSRYIKLTKLPKELFSYNDNPLGIILPYHRGYFAIIDYLNIDKKTLYHLLINILDRLHELENNGIYQLDLNYGNNILYNGEDIQLIDLDGPYIKIGDYNYEKKVYEQFSMTLPVLLGLCFDDEIRSFKREIIKEKLDSYESSIRVVKELKKML